MTTLANTNHSIVKEKFISHSLKEIPSLIRSNLREIKQNWQVIGELLLEARFQFESPEKNEKQVASDFWEWFDHQKFDFTRSSAASYLAATRKYLKIKPRHAATGEPTFTELRRGFGYVQPDREIRDKVRVNIEIARRQTAAALARRSEEDLVRNMALNIIDVGFKTLAVRLHPDKKGGSVEAMRRLNQAKAMLKERI